MPCTTAEEEHCFTIWNYFSGTSFPQARAEDNWSSLVLQSSNPQLGKLQKIRERKRCLTTELHRVSGGAAVPFWSISHPNTRHTHTQLRNTILFVWRLLLAQGLSRYSPIIPTMALLLETQDEHYRHFIDSLSHRRNCTPSRTHLFYRCFHLQSSPHSQTFYLC